MKKVIVLTEGADLDALSASFGVLKLFPEAVLMTPRYLSKRAGAVFKDFKHLFRLVDEFPDEFELVLVDTHHVPEKIPTNKVKGVIVYDHHPLREERGFEGKVEKVGAATTLVVEELIKAGVELTPSEATLIALGIYEDTGNFTYEGTTERDLVAASWLLKKGASLRVLRRYLQEAFTKEQIEIVRNILSSIEKVYLGDREVVIATATLERYEPDINALLYGVKDLKEADAFFIIIEAQNKTYVMGRSQSKDIDVGKVLGRLGGGGHPDAAALKLENVSAARIKNLLVSYLREGRAPAFRIGDLMSSPPFVLPANLSVKEALMKLAEMGFASAPVIDEKGELMGIVSKKSLLKLSRLYPDEPVGDFADGDFSVLSPDSPVWEAEDILTKFGQKLIPVVEGGKVVGVLTRIDILHRMKEDLGELKATRRRVRLPASLRDVFREVGEIASSMGYKAYVVGGVVRDILLGKDVWDLDFVVEGDALEVAREFAKRKGVETHPFPEFGTAHLRTGSLKLEFSTARRETYHRPGAYPKVERASIKEDLVRRDFTINAMAISLSPEDFGTLLDFFGGLRDLKDRIVRILHPVSFIEDPVRVLRALRLAGRLGFRLSRSTENLLKRAVSLGLLGEAPRGRILGELKLALREDSIIEILRLYRRYGVLEHVIKGFLWTQNLEDRLLRLKKVIDWYSLEFPKEKLDFGWVFLMLLLEGLGFRTSAEFLKEVSAPAWVREGVKVLCERGGKIHGELKKANKPSRIYELLRGMHTSVLLILMSDPRITDKIRFYLEKLRFVKVPEEDVKKLIERGLEGRELGKEIEKLRASIMDSLIMEKS